MNEHQVAWHLTMSMRLISQRCRPLPRKPSSLMLCRMCCALVTGDMRYWCRVDY